MGIIATLVTAGICKGLAKIIVKSVGGDAVTEAVAAELAGAAGKTAVERAIDSLVKQHVGSIENHPEFRGLPESDVEAVRFELELSLTPTLNRTFLGPPPFDVQRTLTAIYRERRHNGKPIGFSEPSTQFYQQSLRAAVAAVIVVAENSVDWHAANAKEIHIKLDDLAEDLENAANRHAQILSALSFLERSATELLSAEYRKQMEFLDLYLNAVQTTLDSMELFGLEIDPKSRAKEQRLSVAYITLNLKRECSGAIGGSQSWTDILDQLGLGKQGRLLVRGDAGMGKTTLLRWAAIETAARTTAGPGWMSTYSQHVHHMINDKEKPGSEELQNGPYTAVWRNKIPLLVVLRDCKDGILPTPSQYPAQLCGASGDPPPQFIEWLLQQGKALVMIDGYDEIPTGPKCDIIDRGIKDLLGLYGEKGNIFIVTSRPLVMEPAWVSTFGFATADIAPMTKADRDSLIRNWHKAYAAQLPTEEERTAIQPKAEVLISELDAHPAVARVAATPLLCAMLCAQCGALNYTLPGSEWHIIEGLCYALLWRRDKERTLPLTGTVWDELEYPQRRDIAARLANFMVEQNTPVVDAASANVQLSLALVWVGRDKAKTDAEAKVIRERLSTRGGILRVTRTGALEFVHNTFKEFLAASIFASERNIEFLATHAAREDCANICRYVSGCSNPEYTKNLIEAILKRPDAKTNRILVAIRMSAAPFPLDPATREGIKRLEAGMFPPKSAAECKALSELGNELLDKLAFSSGMPIQSQIMCADVLAQIGTIEAKTVIQAYAPGADDPKLVELLCRAMNPMFIPRVRSAVTKRDEVQGSSLSSAIRSQITDTVLAEWLLTDRELVAVTALNLIGTKVTDTGLKQLARAEAGLNALTWLSLYNTKVTDAGVKELARADSGLTALTALNLIGTLVTDAAVKDLARSNTGLKELIILSLFGPRITDAGVIELARADTGPKALTTLVLPQTKLTDAGLKELARSDTGLKALTSLNLYCTQVTDAGVKEMAREDTGLQTLTALNLGGTKVTDAGIKELARAGTGLKALTKLDLMETEVTDTGVQELARMDTGLKSLTKLSLRGPKVTDAAIQAVRQRWPTIYIGR